MAGYIKLHRKLLEWGWYSDPNTFRLFIHLLLLANFEDHEFRGIKLEPGQLITGRKKLAEDLGMSERQIRTSLNHLKSTNEIAIKSTNKFSVITIVNWAKYQCQVETPTNKTTNNESNERPTTDHIQEGKEIKKTYTAEIAEIVAYLNQATGQRYRPKTKDTVRHITARLNEGFTVDELKAVVDVKTAEWKGTEKQKYLRPETLFGMKCENYVNQASMSRQSQKSNGEGYQKPSEEQMQKDMAMFEELRRQEREEFERRKRGEIT